MYATAADGTTPQMYYRYADIQTVNGVCRTLQYLTAFNLWHGSMRDKDSAPLVSINLEG
jgi:hypothetical protein